MFTQRIHDQMMQNGNGALAPGRSRRWPEERRHQRKLRPRNHGAPHPRRRRRLHPAGRAGSRALLHRLDASTNRPANSPSIPRSMTTARRSFSATKFPPAAACRMAKPCSISSAPAPPRAHHIALEMCQRFVSDDPPADARRPHRRRLHPDRRRSARRSPRRSSTSPEFLSPANYNNKIKSPLEFAVSAVRASESTIIAAATAALRQDRARPSKAPASSAAAQAADRIAKRPRQSLNWHISNWASRSSPARRRPATRRSPSSGSAPAR